MSSAALTPLIVAAGAAVTLAACSSSGSSSGPHQRPGSMDAAGDPFITDNQGRSIRIGETASQAFAALGGKASSGSNRPQAVPPFSYLYPVAGTGNPDDVMDTSTVWWQLCVKGGVVVAKQRGTLDALPTSC